MKLPLIFYLFFSVTSNIVASLQSSDADVVNVCGSDDQCRQMVEDIHQECIGGTASTKVPNGAFYDTIWNRPCANSTSEGVSWVVSGISRSAVFVGVTYRHPTQEIDVFLRPLKQLGPYTVQLDSKNQRLIRVDVNSMFPTTEAVVRPYSFTILAPSPQCRDCLKFVSALDDPVDLGFVRMKFSVNPKCTENLGSLPC